MDLASVIKQHASAGDSFDVVHHHVINVPALLHELIEKYKDLDKEIRLSLVKEITSIDPYMKEGA